MGGVVTAPLSATFDGSSVTLFGRGLDAQLYVKTFTNGWSDWSPLEGVPLASPPVAVSSDEITAVPARAGDRSRIRRVRDAVALRDVGVARVLAVHERRHLHRRNQPGVPQPRARFPGLGADGGGAGVASHPDLRRSPGTVHQLRLRADLRATCSTAIAQGREAANDAANRAGAAGLAPGAPIYFDMEGYNGADPGCTGAVRGFLAGWVLQLHDRGFRAGHVQQPVLRHP